MAEIDHEKLNGKDNVNRRDRPREILDLDALTNRYLMAIDYDDYHEERFGAIIRDIKSAEKARLL